MAFFIAINGKVYLDKPENKALPRLDIENNHFEEREDAYSVSRELEEQHPIIFYGKPTTKEGLILYARRCAEQARRKRAKVLGKSRRAKAKRLL